MVSNSQIFHSNTCKQFKVKPPTQETLISQETFWRATWNWNNARTTINEMHPTGKNVSTRCWIVTDFSYITLYSRLSSQSMWKLHLMRKFGSIHFLPSFMGYTRRHLKHIFSSHNWHQAPQIKHTEPFSTNGATGLKRNMCCPFSSRSTGSSLHKAKTHA